MPSAHEWIQDRLESLLAVLFLEVIKRAAQRRGRTTSLGVQEKGDGDPDRSLSSTMGPPTSLQNITHVQILSKIPLA